MKYKLVAVPELAPGMIIVGVELLDGRVAKTGRFKINKAIGDELLGVYLLRHLCGRFTPDPNHRYEIEVDEDNANDKTTV